MQKMGVLAPLRSLAHLLSTQKAAMKGKPGIALAPSTGEGRFPFSCSLCSMAKNKINCWQVIKKCNCLELLNVYSGDQTLNKPLHSLSQGIFMTRCNQKPQAQRGEAILPMNDTQPRESRAEICTQAVRLSAVQGHLPRPALECLRWGSKRTMMLIFIHIPSPG